MLPVVINMLQAIDNYKGNTLVYDLTSIPKDNADYILKKINEHNLYMTLAYD